MLTLPTSVLKKIHSRFLSTSLTICRKVDKKDIAHLGHFSSQWWDVDGPIKLLHLMNEIRVPFIRDGLISTGAVKAENINKPDVLKGLDILEVGCGAGILTEGLAQLKAKVIGLEPSPELIEAGKEHLKGQSLNIEYISELIEEHSVNNAEKYDAVIASKIIELVPDQRAFLHELIKCVKPNGSIFITTPNKTFVSWLLIKAISENIINIIPEGTHDWNKFISPADLTKILCEKNCKTVIVRGMLFNPLSGIFSFISSDKISYVLHAVKVSSDNLSKQ